MKAVASPLLRRFPTESWGRHHPRFSITAQAFTRPAKGTARQLIETTFDNRFAIVADLGLDQLLVYKFDSSKVP